jgi:hypothetical protein
VGDERFAHAFCTVITHQLVGISLSTVFLHDVFDGCREAGGTETSVVRDPACFPDAKDVAGQVGILRQCLFGGKSKATQ